MKFIRIAQKKSRFREKIVDLLSKALLLAISALACLWMVSGAHAAAISIPAITGIKTESPGSGTYTIDFALSQKVSTDQVAVDFERNFIQVSFKGVSAYPARTENINQATLERVFTYQYQPDLARARILLKTTAAAIKDKASWELIGKTLRITVKGQGAASSAQASDSLKTKAAATSTSDSEEDRIVQEILNEVKPTGKLATAAAASIAAGPRVGENGPIIQKASAAEEQPVFTKPAAEESKGRENAATKIFASLLLVIGIIGACAVAYRRFISGKGFTLNSFQQRPRVIEVISSQSIGPKRSVALVKVLDQYMVLGMAGDGMNLLANLGSDVKIEKFIDQAGGPGSSFNDAFETALSGDSGSEKATGSGAVTHKGSMNLGIRSAIKKRMEGFKPL